MARGWASWVTLWEKRAATLRAMRKVRRPKFFTHHTRIGRLHISISKTGSEQLWSLDPAEKEVGKLSNLLVLNFIERHTTFEDGSLDP